MDSQQLESLYDAFAPAVHAFAFQLTRHEEASKDLLQSVFLRLAHRPRFTILNPRSFLLRGWNQTDDGGSVNSPQIHRPQEQADWGVSVSKR